MAILKTRAVRLSPTGGAGVIFFCGIFSPLSLLEGGRNGVRSRRAAHALPLHFSLSDTDTSTSFNNVLATEAVKLNSLFNGGLIGSAGVGDADRDGCFVRRLIHVLSSFVDVLKPEKNYTYPCKKLSRDFFAYPCK
jgi:hypothetical protein